PAYPRPNLGLSVRCGVGRRAAGLARRWHGDRKATPSSPSWPSIASRPKQRPMWAGYWGYGHSLASVSSWGDDIRDQRPETYNWHSIDIPLAEDRYKPERDCHPSDKGDCIVAALERLIKDLRCAPTDDQKRDALRYAVHFVGDIHQPLHTVDAARG